MKRILALLFLLATAHPASACSVIMFPPDYEFAQRDIVVMARPVGVSFRPKQAAHLRYTGAPETDSPPAAPSRPLRAITKFAWPTGEPISSMATASPSRIAPSSSCLPRNPPATWKTLRKESSPDPQDAVDITRMMLLRDLKNFTRWVCELSVGQDGRILSSRRLP